MNLRIIMKSHEADPEIRFLRNRFQSCMAAQRPCRQCGSKPLDFFCYELNQIKILIIIRLPILIPSLFFLLLKFKIMIIFNYEKSCWREKSNISCFWQVG